MNNIKWILTGMLGIVFLAGCKKEENSTAATNKVRVGYVGITCEAPIFTAVEKGFFKEDGLDIELVKCEWANYRTFWDWVGSMSRITL
jgi:NitT/TauT family transport system substrate-binding protein